MSISKHAVKQAGLGVALLLGMSAWCQGQQEGAPPSGAQGGMPPPMGFRRPPMEKAFHVGPPGRWWNNPAMASRLGLTSQQQRQMEEVFQKSRPTLLTLSGDVSREEAAMTPLLAVSQPDEGKVLAQIDRVAQTRLLLEKANARMLLGLRRVLRQDQWKRLQEDDPSQHMGGDGFPGGPPPHGGGGRPPDESGGPGE